MSDAGADDGERPSAGLAAWFLRCPGGTLIVQRVDEACRPPGAAHAVESWVRLEAIVKGRPFGVLPASVVAEAAPQFVGHAFTDCAIPAVQGSATPLLRGETCRREPSG